VLVLTLFSLLGMQVMITGSNFLTLYLGLELMSLSLYALVAAQRDHPRGAEASMKYFVLSALASGMLLYGLSMLYGTTGSLDLDTVARAVFGHHESPLLMTFGLVFVVSGLAFKLALVPYHMWVPDVFDGAPTSVTLLIATAPDIAAFAMTLRILSGAMQGAAFDWQGMLIVLCVLSMVLGNLIAIAQVNIKRMLAYSTIANMGYMALGFLTANRYGFSAALFYIIAYVLTSLASWGIVLLLSRQGFEAEEITDLAGLGKRSPWMAGVMLIVMFSLAGIPPTVGFYAKLAVLQSLVTTNDPAYITLAVVAVVLSLIGAFYYLRVVKVMYFDEPTESLTITGPAGARALLAVNGVAVLALGLLPSGLMGLCRDAIVKALAT
jgi:NADH-quinone oxidoreductase subunit N